MEHPTNTAAPQIFGALPPPPGVTPNFVDPYSLSGYITATLVVCFVFSTLLVWARIYTRFYITKSHGWDDYTSLAAWLGFAAAFGLTLVSLNYGAGTHQWDVPLEHMITFVKLLYVLSILYAPLLFTIKLSILLTYLRIFVPTHKDNTYYAIHLLIWINLLYYIADILVEIFECIPPRKIWEPLIPGHCLNHLDRALVTCAINVVSDFSILLLPMGKIWHLQISANQKIRLSAAFAIGLCACISSVMALVETIKHFTNEDVTYYVMKRALWGIAELACGILSGCLPVLPRFFNHLNFRLPYTLHSISNAWKRVSQTNSSSATSITRKCPAPKRAPWSSQETEGLYLERLQRSDDRLSPANASCGESCSYSAESSAVEDSNTENEKDLEQGVRAFGIQKMDRVERSDFQ